MNRIAIYCVLFVLTGVVSPQQPANAKSQTTGAKGDTGAAKVLEPVERFNNQRLTFLKGGKPSTGPVTIRDWEIHGRQKVEKFPETGLLVIQLHSGRIITTIGGKEEKREPGDFWTVPAGTSMGVQVTSESANLHVLSISKP